MKKILPSIVSLVILVSFVVLTQVHVQAQSIEGPNPPVDVKIDGIKNPFSGAGDCSGQGSDCLFNFIKTLVEQLILPIGAVVAVCMFIWTGFMFIQAQGNPGAIGKAKQSLLYTSIGTAILLGAWVIAEVIKTTVNELSTAAGH